VIINMASLAGRVPHPFATAYTASKFGVAGFTEALRYEVLTRSAVEVCGIYPGVVDTPIPLHAANHTGRALRPPSPVMDPEHIAGHIVDLASHPRRALHVGLHHAVVPAYAVAPETTGRIMGRLGAFFLLHSGPEAAATNGAIFTPMPGTTGMRIGWGAPQHRKARQAGFGLAAGLAALLLGRRVMLQAALRRSPRQRRPARVIPD
jgi:hypothetical protein